MIATCKNWAYCKCFDDLHSLCWQLINYHLLLVKIKLCRPRDFLGGRVYWKVGGGATEGSEGAEGAGWWCLSTKSPTEVCMFPLVILHISSVSFVLKTSVLKTDYMCYHRIKRQVVELLDFFFFRHIH